MSTISIILPLLNEERYIEACLDSILHSSYSKDAMEIFLVDGGSEDETLQRITPYLKQYPFIHLLHNPKRIVPTAMNLAIKRAKGEYIIRLDAHASYPQDYFEKLMAWHQRLDAENVGAVIETKVKHYTPISEAIIRVLSSSFGVGNASFRIGVLEPTQVDTVPFGCYKREVFEKYGLYDERLVRNQDIELNKRILRQGGKIYLLPDVKCTYYARETLGALAKNQYENGKWNILTAYYTKALDSLSLRHFIPLLFLLTLLLPLICGIWIEKCWLIGAFSLVSYLGFAIIFSIKLHDKRTSVVSLVLAFLTLHLSYGVGSLMGLFSLLKGKK